MNRQATLAGLTMGAMILAALAIITPSAAAGALPPCPFWALTGWHCPGCGSTRALLALLHGEPLAAVAWNPLLPLILPFALVGSRYARMRTWAGWAVLVAVGMFSIARNLPWEPFSLLAPGGMLH